MPNGTVDYLSQNASIGHQHDIRGHNPQESLNFTPRREIFDDTST